MVIIMGKILESNITELKLKKDINKILQENNIEKVYDVCTHSRLELVNLGLSGSQVNDVIVSLQLLGLDLKRNRSKKNTLIEKYVKK